MANGDQEQFKQPFTAEELRQVQTVGDMLGEIVTRRIGNLKVLNRIAMALERQAEATEELARAIKER